MVLWTRLSPRSRLVDSATLLYEGACDKVLRLWLSRPSTANALACTIDVTPRDSPGSFQTVRKIDLVRDPGFVCQALHVDEECQHHVQISGLGESRVWWKMGANQLLDEGACRQLHVGRLSSEMNDKLSER